MEKRQHPRTNYRSPVHFISSHIPYRGCILDVSEGGILIESDSRLKPGTKLQICYSEEEEKVSISKGTVVWSSEDKMGIRF